MDIKAIVKLEEIVNGTAGGMLDTQLINQLQNIRLQDQDQGQVYQNNDGCLNPTAF